MARFRLMLGGRPVQTFDDFKLGIETADSVDAFRAGAIVQWLKENGQNEILERIPHEDPTKASDGRIVRLLLAAIGHDPTTIEGTARRIIRARNQAKAVDTQAEAAESVSAPAQLATRISRKSAPQTSRRSVDGGPAPETRSGRFTLKVAFETAVRSGDIVAVCRDLPKGLWRQTQGGRLNWSDLASCDGWRLQVNDNVFVRQFGNHCRVLDPTNVRHGFGVYSKIELVFRRYWDSLG